MPNSDTILEAFKLLRINEAKQDQINFENKFGKALTDLFIQLKPRIKSPENDFYYWIKNKTVEELSSFLSELKSTKTNSQKKKEEKQGAELIYDNKGWKVYKILTYEASKYYGKGTKWCISGNYPGHEDIGLQHFNNYLRDGVKNYYFIINSDDDKWCYLDLGSDYNSEREERFWAADDHAISLNSLDFPKEIPNDVLNILPNFKDTFKNYGNIDINNYIYQQDQVLSKDMRDIRDRIINVSIPNDVYTIANSAFAFSDKLTSVKISDTVTNIGDNAFVSCGRLSNVKVGKNLKKIGDYAFSQCCRLTNINIPNSVEYIGDSAFFNCESLTSIKIPNSVTSIGMEAFSRCSKLTTIVIPNSVKTIGEWAFADCTNLTNVTISDNMTRIGEGAFASCIKLTEIIFGDMCYKDFKFGKVCPLDSYISIDYMKDADSWNDMNIDMERLKKDFKTLFNIDNFDIIDKYGEVLFTC